MGCSNTYYTMVDDNMTTDIIRIPQSGEHTNIPTKLRVMPSGPVSLGQFSKIKDEINEIETLKLKGLSDIEIKIYIDYKKGQSYLEYVHKNMERSELNKTLENILERIGDSYVVPIGNNDTINSNPGTSRNSDKQYSMDPNFQITNSPEKFSCITHESHPKNHLAELEDDLFGHLDAHTIPLNKKRKFTRRMARKYSKDIPIPEPPPIVDTDFDTKATISYNDFIKLTTDNSSNCISLPSLQVPQINPNSKWDIKNVTDIKPTYKRHSNINTNTDSFKNFKRIGCSPETLYTIKNNKIVRLEPKNNEDKEISGGGIQNKFHVVDIKIPINKAEEQLLEGTKLSIADIKMLPKFEKYETGDPTKKLYIKNISTAVTENELRDLFGDFNNNVNVKLMMGRMKGQAFATCDCTDTASRALQQINGTILKGKPIIIQFGKMGTS